jgi:thiol-disulfide isomerase/thioredoxin
LHLAILSSGGNVSTFISGTIVFIVIFSSLINAQQGKEIVQKAYQTVQQLNAIEWDVTMKNKSLDYDDTTTRRGHVQFVRFQDDSFVLRVLKENSRWQESYITPDTAIDLSEKDSTASLWLREHFPDYFISSHGPDLASDAYTSIKFDETKKAGVSHFFVNALNTYRYTKIPYEESINETSDKWTIQLARKYDTLTLEIRKSDYMLVYGESIILWEGQSQYNSYTFENISLNPVVPSVHERLNSLPDYYRQEVRKPKKREPLEIGSKVEWAGRYLDGDTVSSEDLHGKYVLLKFTYRSCYYCKMSAPMVHEIMKLYPELSVVGLDPFDSGDLKKLREHINKRDVKYPFVLIDPMVPRRLKAGVYPTFYLVDPEGKLAWQQEGYMKDEEERTISEIGKIMEN